MKLYVTPKQIQIIISALQAYRISESLSVHNLLVSNYETIITPEQIDDLLHYLKTK